jgi:hypothetical protein
MFALHHLFQNESSLDVTNVYFTASKYLMDAHISVDEESRQIVPSKDCFQVKIFVADKIFSLEFTLKLTLQYI